MGVQSTTSTHVPGRSAAALLAIAAVLLAGCGSDEDGGTTTSASASAEGEPPHFGYSGEEGPKHWGDLDESYELCVDGDEQSPIDLSDAKKGSPAPVSFDYLEEDVEMENNGHSVEGVPDPGSTVEIDGEPYDLAQFHFHAASEHLVDGESYPLEFHFVNQAADDSLAVFGLFAEQGRANPAFDGITEALPDEEGAGEKVGEPVDLEALLPEDPDGAERWSYPGSLTTPPCSEGVAWFVFADPIEMSSEQIAAFTDLYDDNRRPVQDLNGRTLIIGD